MGFCVQYLILILLFILTLTLTLTLTVSVGALGVCAIHLGGEEGKDELSEIDVNSILISNPNSNPNRGPNAMQCWGFVANLVSPLDTAWDQVAIGERVRVRVS
jgi:hypothetical protein